MSFCMFTRRSKVNITVKSADKIDIDVIYGLSKDLIDKYEDVESID